MTEKLAVVVPVYNEPRIDRTLQGLYDQKQTNGTHHYVVDNGSTDETRAVIGDFKSKHSGFPLTVLEEEQKGTGAAADTGFRSAISDGNLVVARTDGDTVPLPNWTSAISADFSRLPDLQLLGGRSLALRDEDYRRRDDFLLRGAIGGARLALAIRHLDSNYPKAVVGHNMATRSQAYEKVGGFERTSIDETDEDIEYALKVVREFGRSAILLDPDVRVSTSMRRIRSYGVIGTAEHHLRPSKRLAREREIDVR